MKTNTLKGYSADFSFLDNNYNYSYSHSVNYPDIHYYNNLRFADEGLLNGIFLSKSKLEVTIPFKDDIFSELPNKVFNKSFNSSMAKFFNSFRFEYYKMIGKKLLRRVIPKFEFYFNENDNSILIRLVSSWDQGSAMLYYSFENDPKENNFGMIWNDNIKKNYQTRSGNLYLNDMKDIIHESIDFIFRVYSI